MSKILRSSKRVNVAAQHSNGEQVRTGNVAHLVVVEDGLASLVTSHVADSVIVPHGLTE